MGRAAHVDAVEAQQLRGWWGEEAQGVNKEERQARRKSVDVKRARTTSEGRRPAVAAGERGTMDTKANGRPGLRRKRKVSFSTRGQRQGPERSDQLPSGVSPFSAPPPRIMPYETPG